MQRKKILSCVLAAVMAMQGGGVVFAEEKANKNACINLQNEIANQMISSGYLELKEGKVFITEKYKAYIEKSLSNRNDGTYVTFEDDTIIFRSNKNAMGETKIQWTTWGFEIWLDEDICDNVALWVSTAEFIALRLPDEVLSNVVAGLLLAAQALIKQQNLGKGVIVTFNLLPCCIRWVSSQ